MSRSMHSAIQRVYGDTTHDNTMTAVYVHNTVNLLPHIAATSKGSRPTYSDTRTGKGMHTPPG